MNYVIWHFFKPSQLLLYLLLIGWLFRGRPWGKRVIWCAIGWFAAVAFLPISTLLAKSHEERFRRPDVTHVDGIVVLAGSENAPLSTLYGEPQLNEHGDRITTFILLANRFPQARLVHSGGSPNLGRDQSSVAREIIFGAGIDPSRVTFEALSGNTCDSAARAAAAVAPRADEVWLLVTSAFHMPRAVACFKSARWEVRPYPTDFLTGSSPWSIGLADHLRLVDLAAHEWVGLAYYRLRGVTDELFPKAQ